MTSFLTCIHSLLPPATLTFAFIHSNVMHVISPFASVGSSVAFSAAAAAEIAAACLWRGASAHPRSLHARVRGACAKLVLITS